MKMTTRHRVFLESSHSMKAVTDGEVQLIVTSPPYPMIGMWDRTFSAMDPQVGIALENGDGPGAFTLMHGRLDRVWAECHRVLQPGGFLCINIGDATRKVRDCFRLYTNHSRITSFCESLGFQSLPAVLWRKQTNAPNKFMGSGMLPSGAYVTLEHEYILIFRKGDKRGPADLSGDRRSASAFFWEERNAWFSDIWDFKGVRQAISGGETRIRSGAYPFERAYRLICMYSMQGDTVLDPFLGTGTTLAACLSAARNGIGYEIDATMSDVIRETVLRASRSMNAVAQDRLAAHLRFVAEQEARRGIPLGYANEVYGFRTRQETKLRLWRLDSICQTEGIDFEASHSIAMPDQAKPVMLDLKDDGTASDGQL
jgi:modification methylase